MLAMQKMFDLYYANSHGEPEYKIGQQNWKPMTHSEACTARSKFPNPSAIILVEVGIAERKIQYHRKPTEAEIRFGHGATHYRDFKFSECYNPKTGLPKKRLKAKDDRLWYTYG